MVLVIDNYDSFTFNLVQYLGELGETLEVRRNDRLTVNEVSSMSPDAIVILQPTTPIRRPEDHQAASAAFKGDASIDSVVAVEPVPEHYSPHFVMKIEEGRLLPFLEGGLKITRRQDAPKAYSRSGDFYFTRRRTLMEDNSIYGENSRPYVVTHPHRVNLDTLEDWAEAERLVAKETMLAQHEGPVDALHFVTHGSETAVQLGSVWLNASAR